MNIIYRVVVIILSGGSLFLLVACGGNAALLAPDDLATTNAVSDSAGNSQNLTDSLTPVVTGIEATVGPTREDADVATNEAEVEATPTKEVLLPIEVQGPSRGYQTTPQELLEIKRKAAEGIDPYQTAVFWVLEEAVKEWDFVLLKEETCPDAHSPAWNDNGAGTPILYAKALAYHLTGQDRYAEEVKNILERIMSEVETIDLDENQCRLNFAWGTPELVAAADLIEDYWIDQQCTGPVSTLYSDTTVDSGNCKALFQNWLVKNPYYIVSKSTQASSSNWGAAATNTTAYIADYLWDRPDVTLIHRNAEEINNGEDLLFTPAEAYNNANEVAIERMNGYRVEQLSSSSCDRFFANPKQSSEWEPVKSQISEKGIIPEDARRKEYCNIPQYDNANKHTYPQLHLGNNIQQCELMLRRGDRSCYDNVDNSDIPDYTFAINAIIVDAEINWQHDSALEVAYRYYYNNHTMPGIEFWYEQLNRRRARCLHHFCFALLTHGFAPDENPRDPPLVSPLK
jgi:hypothetical protein